MKIGIIGNYGATNIGDDAILTSILIKLKGHEVVVFSAHPKMSKDLFKIKTAPLFPLGIRSFFKLGLRKSIQALKKCDVVILGGGGLFQDNYLYACFLWAWQVFWVKCLKKPLFVYATGVGPLKTKMGQWLAKWAYRKADVITVRDDYSAKVLKKIGIKKEVQVVADPVFLTKVPDNNEHRTKNLFIISLRPWLKYNQKIISIFTSLLQELKEKKNAEFIFVSMQQIKEHDMQMIEPLVSKFGGEVYLPHYFSDLLKVMQRAEFAIGMRFHFMIAAILTQTPLIPISYSPKTEELFQGSELQEYLSHVSQLSKNKLQNDLKRLSVSYNNALIYEKTLLNHHLEQAEIGSRFLGEFLKRFDEKEGG